MWDGGRTEAVAEGVGAAGQDGGEGGENGELGHGGGGGGRLGDVLVVMLTVKLTMR